MRATRPTIVLAALLAVVLHQRPALASGPNSGRCLADICIETDAPAFDGVAILLDVNFGLAREFGERVGLPTVFPRVAIGPAFAVDLPLDQNSSFIRIPVAVPYFGFGPMFWSDSRGRPIRSFAFFFGTNVLGFGDVGVGVGLHDRVPAILGEPLPDVLSAEAVGPALGNGALRDATHCERIVAHWRGWAPEKQAIAQMLWRRAPWQISQVDGVDHWSDAPPEVFDEEATELLRRGCAEGSPVAVLEFIDSYDAYVDDRDFHHRWDRRGLRDGFFYISLSAGTGTRMLLDGLGLSE